MKTNKHKLLTRLDCTFILTEFVWYKKRWIFCHLEPEEASKTLIYVYRNSDSEWIYVPLHKKSSITVKTKRCAHKWHRTSLILPPTKNIKLPLNNKFQTHWKSKSHISNSSQTLQRISSVCWPIWHITENYIQMTRQDSLSWAIQPYAKEIRRGNWYFEEPRIYREQVLCQTECAFESSHLPS